MQSSDRDYFSRRSVEEIHAAMRADSIEATNAHIGLAELHLRRCVGCVEPVTEECADCLAANICFRPRFTDDLIDRPTSSDGGDRLLSLVQDTEVMIIDPTPLSPREMQILRYIARGSSAREVGDVLGTTPRKVERHVDHMRAKLNARNAPHLITRAIVEGILTLPI
jgi:DNA-binding CsgD family transcriptional regulator